MPSSESSSSLAGRRVMRIALSLGAKIYRGPRGVPLREREILKIQKFLLSRARARNRIKLRADSLARTAIPVRIVARRREIEL